MPFVTPALLAHLAARDEPLVVPEAGGRLHPLLARYEPALLDAAARGARRRRARCTRWSPSWAGAASTRRSCARFGDPERLLFNVNTPADLARAEELLGDWLGLALAGAPAQHRARCGTRGPTAAR